MDTCWVHNPLSLNRNSVRADLELSISRHRMTAQCLEDAEPGKELAEISGWPNTSSGCSLGSKQVYISPEDMESQLTSRLLFTKQKKQGHAKDI